MYEELSVLICDDSSLLRMQFKKTLQSIGCTNVYEAVNGEEAVEKYVKYKPDIVFMDIVMPVKTGLDALKEIIEYDSSAKVIMASSVGTSGNLKQALKNGALDFIQKPWSQSNIELVLSKLI
ncbi:MAG: response regulator [Lutispora sp.]|nr:response regulator [Lutispora sp.]MDD4834470.1 response regulator [Lutispora sp.]